MTHIHSKGTNGRRVTDAPADTLANALAAALNIYTKGGAAAAGDISAGDRTAGIGMAAFLEAQIVDAVWTLRRLPDKEAGLLYCRGILWPEFARDYGQDIDYTMNTVLARKRVQPTPRQIDAMQPTLDLLRFIPDQLDRQIVFWGAWHQDGERQTRLPWAKVRRSVGADVSRWTLKRRYAGGLDWLSRVLQQAHEKNFK